MNKSEYKEYLKTDHWNNLKSKKKKRKNRCGICASVDNIETHHLNYKNIYDVTTQDLRLLCRECHQCAHDLMNNGLKFKSRNNHSIFAILKVKVKKARGFGNKNMFINT